MFENLLKVWLEGLIIKIQIFNCPKIRRLPLNHPIAKSCAIHQPFHELFWFTSNFWNQFWRSIATFMRLRFNEFFFNVSMYWTFYKIFLKTLVHRKPNPSKIISTNCMIKNKSIPFKWPKRNRSRQIPDIPFLNWTQY